MRNFIITIDGKQYEVGVEEVGHHGAVNFVVFGFSRNLASEEIAAVGDLVVSHDADHQDDNQCDADTDEDGLLFFFFLLFEFCLLLCRNCFQIGSRTFFLTH